jgi:hypothetical protein
LSLNHLADFGQKFLTVLGSGIVLCGTEENPNKLTGISVTFILFSGFISVNPHRPDQSFFNK